SSSKYLDTTAIYTLSLHDALPISVTVSAAPPVLETTRSSVQSVVNDLAVADLPTLGRNFINFTLLTPGVTTDVRTGDISFAGQRDRKSTRLNSSHDQISYAVFCLK